LTGGRATGRIVDPAEQPVDGANRRADGLLDEIA
jgi:hypothetical protein